MKPNAPTASPNRPKNPGPSPEYALFDFVERLDRHRQGRVGCHIHLSRLQAHNRRDNYLRVALDTFEAMVKAFEGQIFVLRNADIVFVAKGAKVAQIDEAVQKLRFLFGDDPLTQYSDERDSTGFCTWYRLDYDYTRFLSVVRHIHEISELSREDAPHEDFSGGADHRTPLHPAQLGKLEDALGNTDLSNVIRNQAVCALFPGQPPQQIFQELYVSITDLEKAVMPGVALTSNRWLFQYLTQTLDKRVLAHIGREAPRLDKAFSLNLNVLTLLSPEFKKFDGLVSGSLRGRLVIELQKLDIFSDMGAFFFARDYVRERGYRVCVDGLTHLTLPFIDREKMGVDLLKLHWSPEIATNTRSGLVEELKGLISHAGHARMILCRCDNEQAIEMGRNLGIPMYQGRYIDRMLQDRRPAQPPGPRSR